jgi:xylan 1,4-beta-xylosidase
VNALAATDDSTLAVMVWHYHDDDVPGDVVPVELTVNGLPAKEVLLHHYRVDRGHSNSYEVWKKMGLPQNPTPKQYDELEKAGKLHLLASPERITLKEGSLLLKFGLPRQGVSLLKLSY